jgi:hypothetical protein
MAKGLGLAKKKNTFVSNAAYKATDFGTKAAGKKPPVGELPNADRDAYRENYRREMQRRKRRTIA